MSVPKSFLINCYSNIWWLVHFLLILNPNKSDLIISIEIRLHDGSTGSEPAQNSHLPGRSKALKFGTISVQFLNLKYNALRVNELRALVRVPLSPLRAVTN